MRKKEYDCDNQLPEFLMDTMEMVLLLWKIAIVSVTEKQGCISPA